MDITLMMKWEDLLNLITKFLVLLRRYFSDIFTSCSPNPSDFCNICLKLIFRLDSSDYVKSLVHSPKMISKIQSLFLVLIKRLVRISSMPLFFQNFWDIIGDDFSAVCLNILDGFELIKPYNYSNIILLLKIRKPDNLKNFCLICLNSTMYKVVTKQMASTQRSVA